LLPALPVLKKCPSSLLEEADHAAQSICHTVVCLLESQDEDVHVADLEFQEVNQVPNLVFFFLQIVSKAWGSKIR
jgi:hypothetical protein